MVTTTKPELKHYACANCGYDKEIETNHYGQCYSIPGYNECPNCAVRPTVWECMADLPEGMEKPDDWNLLDAKEFGKIWHQINKD